MMLRAIARAVRLAGDASTTVLIREGEPAVDMTDNLKRIETCAATYWPGIQGPVTARISRASHHAYSHVYWIVVEGGGGGIRKVVAKVFPEAEVQFRGMRAVWPAFRDQTHWTIPEPFDLGPGPAIVMEAVSGKTIQSRMPWVFWRAVAPAHVRQDSRRAGQWLRFYHDLGDGGERRSIDVATKLREARESLTGLAESAFPSASCRRIEAALDQLAERVEGRTWPVSHVHGEFTIDNVLIDDDRRVVVLDLWGKHRGIVHLDVSSFLNSLELIRLTRPTLRRSILRGIRREFLQGYFGGTVYDSSAVVFLQAAGLVDVAAEIGSRHAPALVRRWIARLVSDVSHDLIATAEGRQP
jgi:hypothetical protein